MLHALLHVLLATLAEGLLHVDYFSPGQVTHFPANVSRLYLRNFDTVVETRDNTLVLTGKRNVRVGKYVSSLYLLSVR